jgi:hypothetical protein
MLQTIINDRGRDQVAAARERRILVVNPVWPCAEHGVRAANVVIYELVAEFARRRGLKIGFLKLSTASEEAPTAAGHWR